MKAACPIALAAILSLAAGAGCGPASKPQPPPQPPAKAQAAPRPESRPAEALGAVGYDGKKVRSQLDRTLDKNDEHNRQIEKALAE